MTVPQFVIAAGSLAAARLVRDRLASPVADRAGAPILPGDAAPPRAGRPFSRARRGSRVLAPARDPLVSGRV